MTPHLPSTLTHDPALTPVLDAIETGGHRIWLVGGAVRNALLGQPVGDIDLACDARPGQVMALAREAGLKPVPTGFDHGTVTVVSAGRGFEVTTLRRDVATDGRHATVAFGTDLLADAQRRDFTMNALYATRDGRIIDPVSGLPDLLAGHLRFVGEPARRITEDYLRILRFFRFLAWYGRSADPDAITACADLQTGLDHISRERIGQEMRKLLQAPDPGPAVALMDRTGILSRLLPGARPAQMAAFDKIGGSGSMWQGRLAALYAGDPTDALRLSRTETRIHGQLIAARQQDWSFDRIAYRLPDEVACMAALLVQNGGPRPGWDATRKAVRESTFPISAKHLRDRLSGPQLGRGLRAAEEAWIGSGFALPAPALIDIALLAAETEESP